MRTSTMPNFNVLEYDTLPASISNPLTTRRAVIQSVSAHLRAVPSLICARYMLSRIAPKRLARTGKLSSLDSCALGENVFAPIGVTVSGELGACCLSPELLLCNRARNAPATTTYAVLADTVNLGGLSRPPTLTLARAWTRGLSPSCSLLPTEGPTPTPAPTTQPAAPPHWHRWRWEHPNQTCHPPPTRASPFPAFLQAAEQLPWAQAALRFRWPNNERGAPLPPRSAGQRRWFSAAPSDFRPLAVSPELQERLAALGLSAPLPVQTAAVPLILSGRNVAIKSCTGSGKTLAYLLPVVQLALERRRAAVAAAAAGVGNRHDADPPASSDDGGGRSTSAAGRQQALAALKRQSRAPQAVIVGPSRELCIQIQRLAQDLMPEPPANRRLVVQLVGGANPKRQAAALSGGGGAWPLVVVGTPGRVADMMTQGSLHVWGCPLLVLDEADQLYGQRELRQHVDTIVAHVGRHWSPQPPHAAADDPHSTRLGSQPPGTRITHTAPADASTSATDPIGNVSPTSTRSGGSGDGSNVDSGGGSSSVSRGDGSDSVRSGDGSGNGGRGGRQTVLVSASLDARDPGRYACWCPEPQFVVLDSLRALPPKVLQTLHTAPGPAGVTPGPPTTAEPDAPRPPAQGGPNDAPAGQLPPDRLHPLAGGSRSSAGPPAGPDAVNHSGAGATSAAASGELDADGAVAGVGAADGAAAAAGPLSGVLPPHLAHLYVLTHSRHRTDRVRRLIHALQAERVLLFVPKQNQTLVTKYRLEARRMEVTILHGRLTKMERANIVNAFRRGVFRVLVVTDLAARGLDLPDCDAVINFGAPADALAYAHRAGRTGRAGAPGVVVTVVTRLELPGLKRITGQLGVSLQAASVSHGSLAPGEEAMDADPSELE